MFWYQTLKKCNMAAKNQHQKSEGTFFSSRPIHAVQKRPHKIWRDCPCKATKCAHSVNILSVSHYTPDVLSMYIEYLLSKNCVHNVPTNLWLPFTFPACGWIPFGKVKFRKVLWRCDVNWRIDITIHSSLTFPTKVNKCMYISTFHLSRTGKFEMFFKNILFFYISAYKYAEKINPLTHGIGQNCPSKVWRLIT